MCYPINNAKFLRTLLFFKKKKPWAATCTYLVWVILHNKLMGPEKS